MINVNAVAVAVALELGIGYQKDVVGKSARTIFGNSPVVFQIAGSAAGAAAETV